jgi:hypothetical protein
MRRDLTAETRTDTTNIEAEARARGLQPYQVRATQAVGDRLVKDLVSDAYRGISQTASMIPDSARTPAPPTKTGDGWVEARPLVPARGLWATETEEEKQARIARLQDAENREIERRVSREKPYKAKTEYDPLKRYDEQAPSYHRDKS